MDRIVRIVRFEKRLKDDDPEFQIGDPAYDLEGNPVTPLPGSCLVDMTGDIQVILFNEGRHWKLERYLVIELDQRCLKFSIDDRGKVPITGSYLQDVCVRRASKELPIGDFCFEVSGLPDGMSPHDTFNKIRLLETAPPKIGGAVMWELFWQIEIEPSFCAPEKSWLHPFAKNFLENSHKVICDRHEQNVKKVMES